MHKINLNIDENVNEVLDITINNQDQDSNYRLLDISFTPQTQSFPLYLIRIPEVQFSIKAVGLKRIWFHRFPNNWGMRVSWSEITNFYSPSISSITREFYLDNDKDYNVHIHTLGGNDINHINGQQVIYIDIS